MIPTLNKGNCLIFCIMFKCRQPGVKIIVGWNKKSNIVSFSAVHNGRRYFYKRKDRTQSRFYFNGKIVNIKHK